MTPQLDDDVEEPEPEVDDAEVDDISKDKLIKQPKGKGKSRAPAKPAKQKT